LTKAQANQDPNKIMTLQTSP